MGRSVLYVEDEENDAFLLKYAFRTIGIEDPFKHVVDGADAIQYLTGQGHYADRELYPLPCLILLDLNLPRTNGFEVLEWRRENPTARMVPVVVFTSSSQPQDIQRAYALGANGYLIKLPNPEDWTKRAAAIRDFWLEQNIPPLSSFQPEEIP